MDSSSMDFGGTGVEQDSLDLLMTWLQEHGPFHLSVSTLKENDRLEARALYMANMDLIQRSNI